VLCVCVFVAAYSIVSDSIDPMEICLCCLCVFVLFVWFICIYCICLRVDLCVGCVCVCVFFWVCSLSVLIESFCLLSLCHNKPIFSHMLYTDNKVI